MAIHADPQIPSIELINLDFKTRRYSQRHVSFISYTNALLIPAWRYCSRDLVSESLRALHCHVYANLVPSKLSICLKLLTFFFSFILGCLARSNLHGSNGEQYTAEGKRRHWGHLALEPRAGFANCHDAKTGGNIRLVSRYSSKNKRELTFHGPTLFIFFLFLFNIQRSKRRTITPVYVLWSERLPQRYRWDGRYSPCIFGCWIGTAFR